MPSQAPAAPLIRAESPAPIMRTIAPVSKEDPWGDFA
jgi:hypothetical protein